MTGMHIGTWLFTLLKGQLVGTDAAGNSYYEEKAIRPRQRLTAGSSPEDGETRDLISAPFRVTALTGFVLIEKICPAGVAVARIAGAAMILIGMLFVAVS